MANYVCMYVFILANFNKNYRIGAMFSWKEMNTSFDQIGQKLPQLLFKVNKVFLFFFNINMDYVVTRVYFHCRTV